VNICSNDALLPYLNLENVSYTFQVEVKVLPATRFTSGLQVTQNLHMFTVNGNIFKKNPDKV